MEGTARYGDPLPSNSTIPKDVILPGCGFGGGMAALVVSLQRVFGRAKENTLGAAAQR